MKKSLPHNAYAATQQMMRGRFTSLLVMIGLFFSVIVMPVIAHASGNNPVHASEMLDVHEIEDADHSHSQGSDKDMPCHAVSHHHCSVALQLDAPRIGLNRLAKGALVRPAATTPLASRSQAPPLDPPLA
ncbi:MAG: hypothetical protein GXC70_02645 [Sphingomonadaceae bacterium]|nr:hypothetical protein [Sphingomonadaceae bacterium]